MATLLSSYCFREYSFEVFSRFLPMGLCLGQPLGNYGSLTLFKQTYVDFGGWVCLDRQLDGQVCYNRLDGLFAQQLAEFGRVH